MTGDDKYGRKSQTKPLEGHSTPKPPPTRPGRTLPFALAGIGVVSVAAAAFWLGTRTAEPAAVSAAAVTSSPVPATTGSAEVRQQCSEDVRAQLKAPATAQFSDPAPPVQVDSGWLWESYVDAQNSYGALIRTRFRCVSTAGGSGVSSELADSDGRFPSDLKMQANSDLTAAQAEAKSMLNLCAERLIKKYPTADSRKLVTSCFGPDGVFSIDEETEVRHVIGMSVDTGISGEDLKISAETIDAQENEHRWDWENGVVSQAY